MQSTTYQRERGVSEIPAAKFVTKQMVEYQISASQARTHSGRFVMPTTSAPH